LRFAGGVTLGKKTYEEDSKYGQITYIISGDIHIVSTAYVYARRPLSL
jgi:hypothetical protein